MLDKQKMLFLLFRLHASQQKISAARQVVEDSDAALSM